MANGQGGLYISSITATPGLYKVFNSEIYHLALPNFELLAPVASFSLPNSTGWFPTNQIPNLLVSPLQCLLVLFNGSSNGAPLELVGLDPTTLKPLWYTKTPVTTLWLVLLGPCQAMILVQAASLSKPSTMLVAAYNAANGHLLWQVNYLHCGVHHVCNVCHVHITCDSQLTHLLS
jgi:hypothetical protein